MKPLGGGFVAEGFPFDTEGSPCLAGAGGAEISSAVLGPADEGRGDFVGVRRPFQCAFPAVGCHEIDEGFADGFGADAIGQGIGG